VQPSGLPIDLSSAQPGGQATAENRAARARAALARAEERTGARRVDLLTRQSAVPQVPAVSLITSERPPMAVPPPLEPLLPEGLRRGEVTCVLGSTSLAVAMLAHACADGAWAVVLGQPSFGVLAAEQAGVRLDRFALVRQPGPQAGAVLDALLDGVGVVLVGPQVALPVADARRLTARVRERGAVLLATVPWRGAQVVLTARSLVWQGVGAGEGRLRQGRLLVARSGRAGAGVPAALEVVLPVPRPVACPLPAVPTPTPTATSTSPSPLRLVG